MEGKEFTVAFPMRDAHFVGLNEGDIKRVSYNLLALCHNAIGDSVDLSQLSVDPSDYEDLNSFLSREIIEPTIVVFIEKLRHIKEMHLQYQGFLK